LATLNFIRPSALWLVVLTLVAAALYYSLVLATDNNLRDYLVALVPRGLKRVG
jgi:hypothetical protein